MAKNFIALQETLLEVLQDGKDTLVNTNAILAAVGEEVKADGVKRYGLKINKNDSNPETRCTYLFDAVGMQPARMNYETGVFDYGDWADVFFMKNNYPAMVRYDGTEDYRLDPNDHTLKTDGTPSDVANVDYEGNAMSVFDGTADGKIWLSQYEIGNYEYMVISNVRYDESYRDDAYVREDGTSADKLYYPMFKGSYDGTRLRSLAGQQAMDSVNAETLIGCAGANGNGWSIGSWSKINLLNCLLGILAKTDDLQTAFGEGQTSGYVDDSSQNYGKILTGTLTDKGQFYGYSDALHDVKVFFMETRWGMQRDRVMGMIYEYGKILVKMTPPYNLTGEGYEDTGVVFEDKGTGYISRSKSGRYGRIPTEVQGSASTYQCDRFFWDAGYRTMLSVGNCHSGGKYAGPYAMNLNFTATYRDSMHGASLHLEQMTGGAEV